MEAIVLAGGLGTRLRSVISEIPKPMAPIMDKPFLEYIFKYLKKNNITRVVLSVGYKYEIIQEYFGNFFEDIQIIYSIEDEPLGTGGAIKKAISYINSDTFFIINGDTLFNIDLSELKLDSSSLLSISLKFMQDFDRYGCVEFDNKIVTNFREKQYCEQGHINGGIYLCSKMIFDNYILGNKFSFEEFISNNLSTLNIKTFIFKDFFIDIGIPSDYLFAQELIPTIFD